MWWIRKGQALMPTLPMRFLGLMAEMRDACNHSFLLFTRYIFTSLQTVVSFSRIVSFNFLVQRSPPLHQKLNAMLSRNYNFHLKECWSLILIWLASAQISKFSEHLWAAQNVVFWLWHVSPRIEKRCYQDIPTNGL